MWKTRKEDETRPAKPTAPAATPVNIGGRQEVRPVENRMPESTRNATAHIGKSVIIKGQLSGSEDLFLDGEVEGTIDLPGHTLTVGPSAKIRANITARTVVLQGAVAGNVRASEKVELKNPCVLTGDIVTKRIAIDDGAIFKGGVDIQREAVPEAKTAASVGSGAAVAGTHAGTGSATSNTSTTGGAAGEQPSLLPTT